MDIDVDLELEMKTSCRELRLLPLHEFRLGCKTTSNIWGSMDKGALSVRTAQHCFHRFANEDFELDDLLHTERLLQVDMGLLKRLIGEDPRLTRRCLAERVGCSHIAVEIHLHEFGKIWKYLVSIPHELSPLQLQHRVDVSMELSTSHCNYQWLHDLITGNEKWVLYVNYERRRQWLSADPRNVAAPKTDLHPKKVMLERNYSLGNPS